jgi:hypothetical protein
LYVSTAASTRGGWPTPDHDAIIKIPEDVLKFYVREYQEEADY